VSDIFPPAAGPDVSAYRPSVSPYTKIPITYKDMGNKSLQGDYDPGWAGGKQIPILSTLLPSLAAKLGPQITINTGAAFPQPLGETLGHEEVHGIEARNPTKISNLPIFPKAMPLLTSATGTQDPDELPAYAATKTQGGRIFPEAIQKDVTAQYEKSLPAGDAQLYTKIAAGER
jgi:hypothetical protein